MSVKISGTYAGNKKVTLIHGPSQSKIGTAAPVDNNGDGSSFSPTDLVAAALGSCMMTIIGIVAERDGIDVSNMKMEVEKSMSPSPRRIAELPVVLYLPAELGEAERKKLEAAAKTCPVHHSLHPEISIPIEFVYE